MEKLKQYLLTIAVTFLIVYLIGSFFNANFNIREWTLGSRAAGTVVLFLVSTLSLIPSFGGNNY